MVKPTPNPPRRHEDEKNHEAFSVCRKMWRCRLVVLGPILFHFSPSDISAQQGHPLPYQNSPADSVQGSTEEERALLRALEDPATRVEAQYRLAWIYTATAQWQKAEDVISRFLTARPQSPDGLYVLGYALFRQGKYPQSAVALQKSLQIKNDNADAHKILALDYYQLNQTDLAEQELRTATRLNPQLAEVHYFLGRIYYSQNRFEQARRAFERAIQLDSQYVKAYDNLGLTLDALNRADEAAETYQKAIELNERLPLPSKWPYFNLGELLMKGNRSAESIPLLEKALALDPGWTKAHVKLGKAWLQQGKLEEALKSFQTAVHLDPESPDPHYQLGQLYRKLGKLEAAQRELRLFERLRGGGKLVRGEAKLSNEE